MRGAFVGIVGATVIALSIVSLVEHDQRAGPWDVTLATSPVQFHVQGSYHARPYNAPVLGICLEEPCEPHTSIDISFVGLPSAPYQGRLEGVGSLDLGRLAADGDRFVLRWQEAADHTDKQRLVLHLAGQDIASVAVAPAAQPQRIDAPATATWAALPTPVRLNEIGGVTVATVAKARMAQTPPDGWTFHAHFDGLHGIIDLGVLETIGQESVLDVRIERLPLEDQVRLVITLRPAGGDGAFPVLMAAMPAR